MWGHCRFHFSLSKGTEKFWVWNTCLDSQFPPLQKADRQLNSSLLPNTDQSRFLQRSDVSPELLVNRHASKYCRE